jgi:hypothetical protein
MVLLQAIAGGTLFGLKSQPAVQQIVALMMVGSISAVTVLVVGLVAYFALTRPGLLFNPRDIDPSVHWDLYGSGEPPKLPYPDISGVSFVLNPPEENDGTD